LTDILILTASFGMGHNSVSKAIKEQIEIEDKKHKNRNSRSLGNNKP